MAVSDVVLVKAAVVAAARGAIHLLKGGAKAAAKTSTQTFKSLGAAGRSWKNVKMINSNVLQKQGIDAHALKREFLGRNAKIAQYDLYKHIDTGEILIYGWDGIDWFFLYVSDYRFSTININSNAFKLLD